MYIAMDMGTSNTRIWLCDKDKILCCEKRRFGAKLGAVEGRGALFESMRELLSETLTKNGLREGDIECIITSGMAGSEIGLCEISHIRLPSDVYQTAKKVTERTIAEITSIPFRFVPGHSLCRGEEICDVMRGEETEVYGILPELTEITQHAPAVIILPGTHNKIIRINEKEEIVDFQTTMCGEILDMLINQSILKSKVSHDFELSETYVLKGADYAARYGVSAAAFHVRVMEKNRVPKDAKSSFLYGAVIAEDARLIREYARDLPIFIGGNSRLQSVYQILLGNTRAVSLCHEVCENAVIKGLMRIYSLSAAKRLAEKVTNAILRERLICIIRNPDKNTLIPAVRALYEGGIRLVEVTFDRSEKLPRTETAEMISLLCREFGERMLIGAGTVTSKEEVIIARDAGASFIISPNCDAEIISLTKKLGLVSIPAAFTPTEILSALNSGADFIKLFPADAASSAYVKAIKAPISDAKLLAVGGVTADNAADFLTRGFLGVGVGSNLYDKELIAAKDYAALTDLAKKFADAVKGTK